MPERSEAGISRPLSEVKAELFKALGNPARVRILEVLCQGEASVGELQPLVDIELSHLSQQLAVLRRMRLVSSEKRGTQVIYSLVDPQVIDLLAVAKKVLLGSLAQSEDILAELRTAVDGTL